MRLPEQVLGAKLEGGCCARGNVRRVLRVLQISSTKAILSLYGYYRYTPVPTRRWVWVPNRRPDPGERGAAEVRGMDTHGLNPPLDP